MPYEYMNKSMKNTHDKMQIGRAKRTGVEDRLRENMSNPAVAMQMDKHTYDQNQMRMNPGQYMNTYHDSRYKNYIAELGNNEGALQDGMRSTPNEALQERAQTMMKTRMEQATS